MNLEIFGKHTVEFKGMKKEVGSGAELSLIFSKKIVDCIQNMYKGCKQKAATQSQYIQSQQLFSQLLLSFTFNL